MTHDRVRRSRRSSRVHSDPHADVGDVALEVGVEFGGRGDGPVDVLVAEHLAANAHPPRTVLARLAHPPPPPPSRWSSSRALTSAARSQLARWAASTISMRAPGMSEAISSPCSDRRRRVERAGDDQRRRGHPRQIGPQVHRRDRLAAPRVALAVDRRDHRHQRVELVGMGIAVVGREPSADDGLGDRAGAAGAHGRRPLLPRRCRAELGRRAQQRQPIDTVGVVDRQRHPDHRPDRQPDDVRPLDPGRRGRRRPRRRARRSCTAPARSGSYRGRGGRRAGSGSGRRGRRSAAPTSPSCCRATRATRPRARRRRRPPRRAAR